MRTVILSLLLVSFSERSVADVASKNWSFLGQEISITTLGGNSRIILGNCPGASVKPRCLAHSKLKALSKKAMSPTIGKGGANPSSDICRRVYNGRVIIALDNRGNEQSFCTFPDGSMFSSDSMFAAKNLFSQE